MGKLAVILLAASACGGSGTKPTDAGGGDDGPTVDSSSDAGPTPDDVDADGVLFREVGKGENIQFPLLTGLRADQLATSNRAMRVKLQDAMRLGDLMTQDSHVLSEIHFDSAERVVLYTTSYPVALRMGWGDWDDKIKRLDRVLGLWKGQEERLASLDVSFKDQVVAKVNQIKQ